MQIVINISEEDLDAIEKLKSKGWASRHELSILNGIRLPKGHGRLIDADAYIDKYEECGWLDDITVDEFNANTPTIIEADKED